MRKEVRMIRGQIIREDQDKEEARDRRRTRNNWVRDDVDERNEWYIQD